MINTSSVIQPAFFDIRSTPKHPAKYTDVLIPVFAGMLKGSRRILDPMAGTGKIFELERWLSGVEIQATEIEPEWAAINPKTTLGNALDLPWSDDHFDAICVSPPYGNRFADSYAGDAKGSIRHTYRIYLGRPLSQDNAGGLQWGEGYRDFHVRAWTEARRVLSSGGLMVINSKDHVRNGKRKFVSAWHCKAMVKLGFSIVAHERIETPGQKHGENSELRINYEDVIKFRLDRKYVGSVIPEGYCKCGCGNKTTIPTQNNIALGRKKGVPMEYIRNHHYPVATSLENIFYSWLPDAWSDDDCWTWQGTLNTRNKYGMLWYENKIHLAHRVAYEVCYGVNPGDLNVCHHCDNPSCVNPSHLFLGTDIDNMNDKKAKDRQAKGEQHGMAKLMPEQVIDIRAKYALGNITLKELSNEYGVTLEHISSIVRGVTWKHI